MEISINHIRSEDDPKFGKVPIGWMYADERSSIVFSPPERVRSVEINKKHAKSASRCPAILGLENRYILIRCPFDIHLAFERDKNGQPMLRNCLGNRSPVRKNTLHKSILLTSESEWRSPDRPMIQLNLPYMFIADEPVYMSQVPPFFHYEDKNPLPGVMFGGRFPIDVWPRPIMWAFEWHNPKKEIILKRGTPLFYCHFEFDNPERSFKLFEAEKTTELDDYVNKIAGAVNYVNQTFSLFEQAKEVRPQTLLREKESLKK